MSERMGAGSGDQADVAADLLELVAELAGVLPEATAAELVAQVDWDDWPAYAPTMIVPGLFQGGTEDDDVLSVPCDDWRLRGSFPFDVVITLYASARPVPWGVEELRFGFVDAELAGGDVDGVLRAARYAYQRWMDGAQVLVRCQAGMNRSGLVTALVLVMAGLTAAQAITLIRLCRGGACLMNDHFVHWLVAHGGAAVQPSQPVPPASPAQPGPPPAVDAA